jgi:hypothetical protein
MQNWNVIYISPSKVGEGGTRSEFAYKYLRGYWAYGARKGSNLRTVKRGGILFPTQLQPNYLGIEV